MSVLNDMVGKIITGWNSDPASLSDLSTEEIMALTNNDYLRYCLNG